MAKRYRRRVRTLGEIQETLGELGKMVMVCARKRPDGKCAEMVASPVGAGFIGKRYPGAVARFLGRKTGFTTRGRALAKAHPEGAKKFIAAANSCRRQLPSTESRTGGRWTECMRDELRATYKGYTKKPRVKRPRKGRKK